MDCGVKVGVGSGPIRTSEGVGGSIVGIGSKIRGGAKLTGDVAASGMPEISVTERLVGMFLGGCGCRSRKGLQKLPPIESSSGVKRGRIFRHELMKPDEPGDGGCCDVYLMRISCQRSNSGSGTCSFQLTAWRKAISLVLISHTVKPDILLQARAE